MDDAARSARLLPMRRSLVHVSATYNFRYLSGGTIAPLIGQAAARSTSELTHGAMACWLSIAALLRVLDVLVLFVILEHVCGLVHAVPAGLDFALLYFIQLVCGVAHREVVSKVLWQF